VSSKVFNSVFGKLQGFKWENVLKVACRYFQYLLNESLYLWSQGTINFLWEFEFWGVLKSTVGSWPPQLWC